MEIWCAFGADPGRSLVARRAALGQRYYLWSLLSFRADQGPLRRSGAREITEILKASKKNKRTNKTGTDNLDTFHCVPALRVC